MSILSSIFAKIFPPSHPAVTDPVAAVPAAASTAPASALTPAPAPVAAMPAVDVAQQLDGMAQQSAEKLNWKTSIVDLMKLLGLDSSLTARKQLAQELHYSGDTADSATMNIWLHRQVMDKIAANGGKLPADLAAH